MKLPIYLPTCDHTMKILPAMAYCINKFWPGQEVYVLGYATPSLEIELPKNFFYISLGMDAGPGQWSIGIIDWVIEHGADYFIFGVDDMLPIVPVNQDLIDWLVKTHCNAGTGRIGLTNDIQHRLCNEVGGKYTTVFAAREAKYRVSTLFSIWRREAFLKSIQPSMSPWYFEKHGKVQEDVIGTRNKYAIHTSHGLPSLNIPQHTWNKCICCNITPDKETARVLQYLLPHNTVIPERLLP